MHPFQVYMLCAMFSILGEDYCQIFSVVDLHVDHVDCSQTMH